MASEPEREERHDPVALIAAKVRELSAGDRAALRRLYLLQSSGSRGRSAEGVVIGLLHDAKVDLRMQTEDFARWNLLAHVAALLSGTGRERAHQKERHLGAALQAADYSENRLLRLTSARGSALYDQIRRAARVLAQKSAGPVDLWDIHHLTGRSIGSAERARLNIARHYYAAAVRPEGDEK